MLTSAQIGRVEQLFRSALSGYGEIFGAEHPKTCDACNNFSAFLITQQNYDEARTFAERALRGKEKFHGLMHPTTLNSVVACAIACLHTGDREYAKTLGKLRL